MEKIVDIYEKKVKGVEPNIELEKVNSIKFKIDTLVADKSALEEQIVELQKQRAADLVDGKNVNNSTANQLTGLRGEVESFDLALQMLRERLIEALEEEIHEKRKAAHLKINELLPQKIEAGSNIDNIRMKFMEDLQKAEVTYRQIENQIRQQQDIINKPRKMVSQKVIDDNTPIERQITTGAHFTDQNGTKAFGGLY